MLNRKLRNGRDSQREKLYKAEREAFSKVREKYATKSQAQKFFDKVVNSDWFKCRVVTTTVLKFRNSAGSSYCEKSYTEYLVRLSTAHWTDWVIVHELAHIVVSRAYGWVNSDIASHGPEFCKTYLQMVYRYIGKDAADALRDSYKAHGVKYVANTDSIERIAKNIKEARLKIKAVYVYCTTCGKRNTEMRDSAFCSKCKTKHADNGHRL